MGIFKFWGSCKRSVLKYETQLKVFWGSQDQYNHNFWRHLENSNVGHFGHPYHTISSWKPVQIIGERLMEKSWLAGQLAGRDNSLCRNLPQLGFDERGRSTRSTQQQQQEEQQEEQEEQKEQEEQEEQEEWPELELRTRPHNGEKPHSSSATNSAQQNIFCISLFSFFKWILYFFVQFLQVDFQSYFLMSHSKSTQENTFCNRDCVLNVL